MHYRPKFAGLLAAWSIALLVAGCGESVSPGRRLDAPQFAEGDGSITLSAKSGTCCWVDPTNDIRKGFNPVNPHHGDAVVATFFWRGTTTNVITSIADSLTSRRPVGNTYSLVEYVNHNGWSMATYVATNVQNFPDVRPLPSQDSVLVVIAKLSQPVFDAGILVSSYSGVAAASALGEHRSASGSANSQTSAAPGPINVGAGALMYTTSVGSPPWGHQPPAGTTHINNVSNSAVKLVGEFMVQANAGPNDPQWIWFFGEPASWLTTVLALNPGSAPPPPTTGNLAVTASTTGSNLDPDGYTVTVDGGTSQAVTINGTVTFNGLTAASHSVALTGVAANCTVSGANPRTVTVPAGGTASTTFSVSCVTTPPPTGNLAVTASTTGSNLDPDGYTATVDGGTSQAVAINGSVTFSGLTAGDHGVALSGVAANCTVSGANPRTVTVPAGGTASTTFAVSCVTTPPPTGDLQVTASTGGSNLDPDGYTATVDGGASQAVATNGSVTFTSLAAGSHSVALSGIAANCSVSGANPQSVNVPSGGTVTASFSVNCTGPTTGNLDVSASTIGSDQDTNGYIVTVDGGQSQAIGSNSSVTFTGLAAGSHSVALSGVAANCSVLDANPQTVDVPSGGTGSASFTIDCASLAGDLAVNTSTTGSSLDPNGYTVTVDGSQSQAIGINGSVTFTGLPAGGHSVALSGVASNCTVSGSNPRSVNVPAGGTGSTTFSVSCTTPPGNLSVTASTTGSSLDPDGYTVTVDGSQSQAVATNGTVTFTGLSAGSHSVALSGVASNCTLSGANQRTITVPSGGTVSTTFSVSCVTPNTAPTVNAGPDQTSLIGLLYTLNAAFSDPDNGPWTYTINWGDGTTTTGSASTSPGSITRTHTYLLLGTYTITVTVRDSQGATGSDVKVVRFIL